MGMCMGRGTDKPAGYMGEEVKDMDGVEDVQAVEFMEDTEDEKVG